MRLQTSQANCGPAALSNALSAIGIERSIKECEVLCSVSAAEGTSAAKLVRALSKIDGVSPFRIDERRIDVASLLLRAALDDGRPAILLVDQWDHWVAAIGLLGSGRVLVADSADSDLVLSYTWAQLVKRWGCVEARRPFWGVVL